MADEIQFKLDGMCSHMDNVVLSAASRAVSAFQRDVPRVYATGSSEDVDLECPDGIVRPCRITVSIACIED